MADNKRKTDAGLGGQYGPSAMPDPDQKLAPLADLSPQEIEKILLSQHYHQLELETQNAELRRVQADLDAARARYFDLYDQAPVGYCTLSPLGQILEANLTAASLLRLAREKLVGQPFALFVHDLDQELYVSHLAAVLESREPQVGQLRLFSAARPPFWAQLNLTAALEAGGTVACRVVLSDISRQKRDEAVMAARLRLKRLADSLRLVEFIQVTLDEVEALTDSQIGFFHLLAPGQATVAIRAWSTHTLSCLCKVAGEARDCPDIHAGIWGECIRRQQPVIHNRSGELPHRPNLPPGHVPVTRELVVPLVRGDEVVAVLGVGNKPSDYHQRDVEVVTTLADLVWDITERKQAEEAFWASERQRLTVQETANFRLREQNERLQSIYQALDSIGLIVCDLEGGDARIKVFSVGAEKLFGLRQNEALEQSLAIIFPAELLAGVAERVERLSQGEAMLSFDMTLMRQSGVPFPAVVSIHPFARREGRFHKVVGVFRDISELIRVQEELKASNEELERRVEQRTRELQETQMQYLHSEKLSAIGKLSASIAHEFNNPLQGILAVLKGLERRAILEDEDRELLTAAVGECDRIKELIRNLQDFNRPTSGRQELMDLHRSINAVLLLQKSDFKGRRIKVKTAYAEHLPQLMAVPDQIKQVILNLLANAADACQTPGGVITVSTWREGGRVAFAISDTGIGIQPEAMPRLFEPFYTTKPEVKGTGLGLPVSYGIVKRHGGEIRVASEPGQGATFTVFLPIAPSGAEIPAAVERRPPVVGVRGLAGTKGGADDD
jgi:PAS domain S-box-containing protein